jgi:hypothetical protein
MAAADPIQLLAQSPPFQGLHTVGLETVLQFAQRRWVERAAFFGGRP